MLRCLLRILAAIGVILLTSAAAILFLVYHYGADLPDYQHLAHYKPPIVTRLYANDGRMFAEYAWEKRIYVPVQAISKRVVQAFLAAEDKNFYEHSGIDIPSIISAALTNIGRVAESRRPVGASTITQQVAKNFLLADIAHAVSYERKIKEALLAFRIESAYSKDYILELFLNEIYLGSGSYGVAAAALNYFNKSLDELTIAEVAYLAGLPKAPSRYHPSRYPEAAKIRRDYVIRRMFEDGHITAEEANKAADEPIILHERDPGGVVHASYFAEEVRRALIEKFGEKALYQEGLVVRTSLDPSLQELAQQALRQGLIDYDRRHGWRGPVFRLALSDNERTGSQKGLEKEKGSSAAWIPKLKSVIAPSGIGGWRMAVVLDLQAQFATIGFEDGTMGRIALAELQWARKYISEYALGGVIRHPRDVLSIGDVVLVEPLNPVPYAIKPSPSLEKRIEPSLQTQEFRLCQIPLVSGGIVVMNPHTGRVLAMHGGFSFEISQFNRVTQAMRQVGSAFKPFAYLAALEKGLTPSTLLYDGPFSMDMGYSLGIWTPHNYEKDYLGSITLRRALELSRNLVIIRMTHDYVGMENVKRVAEKLGIVESLPLHLATVLGAAESTLLKVTTAYAMIANGGRRLTPTLLDRIQDRQGKNLYVNEARFCEGCHHAYWMNTPPSLIDRRQQVIDPATAYQMISLLQGAVERGTAKSLRELDRPLAGKTGTSNDYRDTWFVGFTPDLVVGVFVGFDTPRDLGQHETGARVALPVFKNFMAAALKNAPAIPFRIPPGIKLVRVDAMTGLPAAGGSGPHVILEAFKSETDENSFGKPPVARNLSVEREVGIGVGVDTGDESGMSPEAEAVSGAGIDERWPPRSVPDFPPVSPSPRHTIEGTGGLY